MLESIIFEYEVVEKFNQQKKGKVPSDEVFERVKFLKKILLAADAVICARSTPKQKAQLVSVVTNSGKICLAVGDGANDVSMIVQASVGVGLYGKEGLQAVQVSDYGLPSFQYLWRLMFFEGRRSYLRISKFFVMYIFKSAMVTIMSLYYGFYSAWSGVTMFDGWYLFVYGVIFSAGTFSWIGIMDEDIIYQTVLSKKTKVQDLDKREDNSRLSLADQEQQLMKKSEREKEQAFPPYTDDTNYLKNSIFRTNNLMKENLHHFYYMSQKETFFTLKYFIIFFIESVVVSLFILLFCIWMLEDQSVESNGTDRADFSNLTQITFVVVNINVNIVVLLCADHLSNFLLNLTFWTSIVPLGLFMYVYDTLSAFNLDTLGTSRSNFSQIIMSIRILCILVLTALPQVVRYFFKFMVQPSLSQYVMMIKNLNKEFDPSSWKIELIKRLKKQHLKSIRSAK